MHDQNHTKFKFPITLHVKKLVSRVTEKSMGWGYLRTDKLQKYFGLRRRKQNATKENCLTQTSLIFITQQILSGCVKGVLFPVAKQKEREVDHSASFKVGFENEWSCTSNFSICVQFRAQNNFTFISADDIDRPTSSKRQQLTIESPRTNFRNENIFHWKLLSSKLVYVHLSKKPTASNIILSTLRFGPDICTYSKDYKTP